MNPEARAELDRILALSIPELTPQDIAFLNGRRWALTPEERSRFSSVLQSDEGSPSNPPASTPQVLNPEPNPTPPVENSAPIPQPEAASGAVAAQPETTQETSTVVDDHSADPDWKPQQP